MAAITYQTEGAEAGAQTEALIKYLAAHATDLKLDITRIALWSCSANTGIATYMVAEHAPADFRAAVFYYGVMQTPPKQPDVPVLIAKAGLDSLFINESIDNWVTAALAIDAPVTLMTYPEGVHAFDLRNETEEAREIIRRTLDFLHFHLNNPRPARSQPMTPAQLTKVAMTSIDDAMGRIVELRKSHPKALVVQEESMNNLGYELMRAGKNADAVKLFELMVKMYAASPNAFDSLGDAYMAVGRNEDAVNAAERAINLLRMAPEDIREGIRRSAEEKLQKLKPAAK
jgi:dienelactone hydrolase